MKYIVEGELRTKGESRHCFVDKEMKPDRHEAAVPGDL